MLKLHKRCQVRLQNISAQAYNFPIHRLWIHHSQHNSVMFSWYHFDEEEKLFGYWLNLHEFNLCFGQVTAVTGLKYEIGRSPFSPRATESTPYQNL